MNKEVHKVVNIFTKPGCGPSMHAMSIAQQMHAAHTEHAPSNSMFQLRASSIAPPIEIPVPDGDITKFHNSDIGQQTREQGSHRLWTFPAVVVEEMDGKLRFVPGADEFKRQMTVLPARRRRKLLTRMPR